MYSTYNILYIIYLDSSDLFVVFYAMFVYFDTFGALPFALLFVVVAADVVFAAAAVVATTVVIAVVVLAVVVAAASASVCRCVGDFSINNFPYFLVPLPFFPFPPAFECIRVYSYECIHKYF